MPPCWQTQGKCPTEVRGPTCNLQRSDADIIPSQMRQTLSGLNPVICYLIHVVPVVYS